MASPAPPSPTPSSSNPAPMAMDAATRLPSIDGLRAFEAAARLGSFERAADELAVTASAVSKRLATLEDLLGTPLLERGARSLKLTAAGKEYLVPVRQALGLLAAVPLHRRARGLQRLRVCAPPTFARQILVPALASFTDAHADIELEVMLSIPYVDARAADADVEVVFHAPADGDTVLSRDRVLPVASPTLRDALPPIAQPADMAGAPLLRTPLEPWAPWFAAAGLDQAEPSSGPKLLDLGLLLEAAVAGQGVALARPTLAMHWLASGRLVPLGTLTAVPRQQYVALPHAGEAAQHFVQWLQGVCDADARRAEEWLSRLA